MGEIDRSLIGRTFPSHKVEVEKGRLRFFAHVIGETNPVYFEDVAAFAAGHPAIPVPPTFLFCLEMDRPNALAWLHDFGFDPGRILHGEQHFDYWNQAYAGDTLIFRSRVTDLYEKRGGSLHFIHRTTEVRRNDDTPIAELCSVIVQPQ